MKNPRLFIFLTIVLWPLSTAVLGAGAERSVSEALTLTISERFVRPAAAEKLIYVQGISKLAGVAHPIDIKKIPAKAHPAIAQLRLDPLRLLPLAEAQYRKGDFVRGAYLTQRVTQVCSECHAYLKKPTWKFLGPTSRLSALEYAEFFRAARRYDDALLHYEKILNAPGLAASQPQVWEKAALNIISLGVETSSNAYTFVDLVSSSLAAVNHPPAQKALLQSWRTTGKAWGAEPAAITKPFDLLIHARQLISTGDQMNSRQRLSGFVHHVRAMHVLRLVAQKGSPAQKSRAFLMSAQMRDRFPIDGVYLNVEDYYEACARVSPKGADARKCYSELQSLSQRMLKYMPDTSVLRALQPSAR